MRPLVLALIAVVAFAQPDALRQAEAALSRGDYAAALQLAAPVAAAAPNGAAENILGVAHLNRGNYAAARPHFEKAASLARAAGDLPAEIRRLNNLGNVDFYLGQYVQAHQTYQSALARLQGHDSQPWYPGTRQLTLTNLAVLHQQLGQHRRALDLYKEIRALPLQLQPAVEAQVLTNLAIVYRRLGDPQQALDTYRRARQLLQSDPNAAASLFILHNVGVLQALDFRDLPAALQTFNEAMALAARSGSKRELVLQHLFRGETLLLLNRPAAARADFEAALASAQSLNLIDERWTALYGLGRTQLAAGDRPAALASFRDAIAVIESARSSLGNTSLKAEFLAGKRDVYDALIAALLDQPNPAPAELLRRFEEARARNLKELLPAERQSVSLPTLQSSLDPRTAVLAYWTAGYRIAAVTITRSSARVWQREISPDLAAAIPALARAAADRSSQSWRELAARVAAILPPLDDPALDRLVLVPDDTLHSIPFEILPLPTGNRVLDRFAVSYLPSAHFLAAPPTAPRRRWPWQPTLAAFADPQSGPAAGPFDNGWAPLPFAAEEARAAAAALPGRSLLHLGPANQKRDVLDPATGRIPVLHFATHGAIDVTDSRRSRLLFTPTPADPASQYLFAGEIAKLPFPAVELVTLAACESERGRYVRGEGVENFSRAFLGAGARATVSSLWRVSDRASAELMGHFYRRLAAGATKAEALRDAKLALARQSGPQSHPYYWAPYLLSGDAHTPLSPTLPWWPFAAAAAAVIFLLTFLFRRRPRVV